MRLDLRLPKKKAISICRQGLGLVAEEDSKEFTPYHFTPTQIVKMLEMGITVYKTDEEAASEPHAAWTDAEVEAFHADLNLICEGQRNCAWPSSLWDIESDEWLKRLDWRLRLCPAPHCLFRLLIAKKNAEKLHAGCKSIQHREQKRISKRKERELKRGAETRN